MIASLQGKLEALNASSAIINVGGVGYQVYMPVPTLSILGQLGSSVKVYTHLHVREDIMALHGFATPEELRLFETLITVSGIGPKLAMATISAMNVEQVTMAIASGNADLLRQVPGIGKKTAERIVLELKDKMEVQLLTLPVSQLSQGNADVVSALISLGYSVSEAMRASASLPARSDSSLQEKIKLALQYFGGR